MPEEMYASLSRKLDEEVNKTGDDNHRLWHLIQSHVMMVLWSMEVSQGAQTSNVCALCCDALLVLVWIVKCMELARAFPRKTDAQARPATERQRGSSCVQRTNATTHSPKAPSNGRGERERDGEGEGGRERERNQTTHHGSMLLEN